MPLRDHFRPPVSKRCSWEGHGGWPMRVVEELSPRLPVGFVAEPRVHLGSYYEIDVCAFDANQEGESVVRPARESNVQVAPALQTVPAPTLTFEAEFPEQYAYEVLVFDLERARRLVAGRRNRQPGQQGPAREPAVICRQVPQPAAPRSLSLHRRCRHNSSIQSLCRVAGTSRLLRPGVRAAGVAHLCGDLSQTEHSWAIEVGNLVLAVGHWPAASFVPDLALGNAVGAAGVGGELRRDVPSPTSCVRTGAGRWGWALRCP